MNIAKIERVSLGGKLNGFEPVQFLRAERLGPESYLLYIYYAVNGKPAEQPLAMDVMGFFLYDKTGIATVDEALVQRGQEITDAVRAAFVPRRRAAPMPAQ